ncbi:MAG: type I-E CRISPR-associated protein Cas7/Cse4/CasC [Lachnospiraceae bacterium]|nr:type I-E CRISPR-associated protein Cas7/Cse4/CasC [Lachnospiraceae bacterium]
MKNFFVDYHVLQTVPPSCINRDDTGSPKAAVYGGVTRARVSSQSWKRAIKLMFKELLEEERLGVRTLELGDYVADHIRKLEADIKKPEKLAEEVLKAAGIPLKDGKAKALFLISDRQAQRLAEAALRLQSGDGEREKKKKGDDELKAILRDTPSIDMALFGRMVADDASLNYDAACQVAHSISTHAVRNEYDYFTAVDEYKSSEDAGAGHINTTEFNSATFYRYATLNLYELYCGLKNESDILDAVSVFTKAFLCSMPTGHQNSFANRTVPDLAYITVRRDQPVNMAGAFEEPVKAKNGEGYVLLSEMRLMDYAEKMYGTFVDKPERAFGIGRLDRLKEMAEVSSLKSVSESLLEEVRGYLGEWRK